MRALTSVLLAACAVTALGCQESGFDERKETAQPLKVQHVLGESKVPGQADRPVTLSVDALDDTLALGVRPVRAAAPGRELPAYLRSEAGGFELMPPVTGRAGVATVKRAHPDVIVGSEAGEGRFYEGLTLIAPTVMTEGGSGQWKLTLRLVGEALGRTNDAEALLTEYDRVSGRLRASLRGKRRVRVAVVRVRGRRVRAAPRDSFAGTVLADAGVKQVALPWKADLVLVAGPADAARRLPTRTERVDEALWWGPGGFLAGRAAVRDLQGNLRR